MMTLNEARAIGASKLNIPDGLFKKCVEAAHEMAVDGRHLGPMALALGIMGIAKATDAAEIEGELTDALALVSKAEKEWRMDLKMETRH